ncbi:MAG: hypothetical protein AAF467_27670 [Actinomycetota bacterium]
MGDEAFIVEVLAQDSDGDVAWALFGPWGRFDKACSKAGVLAGDLALPLVDPGEWRRYIDESMVEVVVRPVDPLGSATITNSIMDECRSVIAKATATCAALDDGGTP